MSEKFENVPHIGVVNIKYDTEVHQLNADGSVDPSPKFSGNNKNSYLVGVYGQDLQSCTVNLIAMLKKIDKILNEDLNAKDTLARSVGCDLQKNGTEEVRPETA